MLFPALFPLLLCTTQCLGVSPNLRLLYHRSSVYSIFRRTLSFLRALSYSGLSALQRFYRIMMIRISFCKLFSFNLILLFSSSFNGPSTKKYEYRSSFDGMKRKAPAPSFPTNTISCIYTRKTLYEIEAFVDHKCVLTGSSNSVVRVQKTFYL